MTKTVEYRYDALGRRIEKSVDDNGNGTVDRREQYIYDGAGLLTASGGSVSISGPNGELNQHGWVDDVVLVLDGAGTIQHRYLHGPLIDQVFADETAGGEVLWSLADHLGTVQISKTLQQVLDDADLNVNVRVQVTKNSNTDMGREYDLLYYDTQMNWIGNKLNPTVWVVGIFHWPYVAMAEDLLSWNGRIIMKNTIDVVATTPNQDGPT